MATINPLTGQPTMGVASQSSDILNPAAESILGGDYPPLSAPAATYTVASGQNLAALAVVGFNGSGEIVAADISDANPANHIRAIGVLPNAVDATGGAVESQVYRTGNFNPDRLVWPASYDTDAERAKAFDAAPTPTHIYVTKTVQFTAP